jgi:HPt (histidine-containing phosphotransfer) domain-containing protein
MEPMPALDPAVVGRLAARWGTPFAHRMLAAFVEQCNTRCTAARQALAKGDNAGVGGAAHALRSSAGNVGAAWLAAAAQRLEAAAGNTPAAALAPLVGALVEASDAARSAAADWMALHPPDP